MKTSIQLTDENGKNPVDFEFYIDDSDLVIETVEIKIRSESITYYQNPDLAFFIQACGGKDAIIRKAIASTIPDDCEVAKSERELDLEQGA
jgi:hypothetical protein